MSHYQLYGAEISYFTGKVRAYLRWKALPYEEIVANANVYREVILPRVGFAVIPVLITPDGQTLQDSTDIIEALEVRHPGPALQPTGGLQRLVATLMEMYGDEWLVIPAMHYRWHHNREWAVRAFGELSAPDASPLAQLEVGARRAGPFAQAAEWLGATPDMHAAVERSYEGLLGELDQHFALLPFLLGTRPSVGDFGLYGPLYAHLYRDPASGALMRRLAPNVVAWVERMRDAPAPNKGDFLPNDNVPITLMPVLRRMMVEQMPVLADSARLLVQWLGEHAGERVPRFIGTHAFELEGSRGQRIVRPYSLWMMQRARDVFAGLSGAEAQRARDGLIDAGGQLFLDYVDPPRLARDGLSVRVT